MKTDEEYIKDLTEIRSIMERSTKFLTLTGWAGIMLGIYALVGICVAYNLSYFSSDAITYNTVNRQDLADNILNLSVLAVVILIIGLSTAILFSRRKSQKTGESLWNAAARRVVINMAIPLITGGIFILILISKGLFGLMAPASLLFYGLALINASKYTFSEYRNLGIIEIILGLVASYYIGYGPIIWAIGFGVMHIIYGIYLHLKYEK